LDLDASKAAQESTQLRLRRAVIESEAAGHRLAELSKEKDALVDLCAANNSRVVAFENDIDARDQRLAVLQAERDAIAQEFLGDDYMREVRREHASDFIPNHTPMLPPLIVLRPFSCFLLFHQTAVAAETFSTERRKFDLSPLPKDYSSSNW
jgi:hypothetical protein